MKAAPYLEGAWDAAIEGYYRAEIVEGAEPWRELVARVRHPALLINAVGAYGPPGSIPLVSEEYARETAEAFPDCRYVQVPGNQLTMVFCEGAAAIRREIAAFVRNGTT